MVRIRTHFGAVRRAIGGTWSVENMNGHAVLVMQLQGAQPMVTYGPYGPQPIEWPAAEQWAIASVQPNQVNLFGAFMVRRFLQAATPPPVQSTGAQIPAGSAATVRPQVPAAAANPEKPPVQIPAPPPPDATHSIAGLDLSSRGSYLGPANPAPAPMVNRPQILNQWQNMQFSNMQAGSNSLFSAPQQPASTAGMFAADNQTSIDIFKMQHAANLDWMTARQQAVLDEEKARHDIAKQYINYARS